jgi:hypothetical protein
MKRLDAVLLLCECLNLSGDAWDRVDKLRQKLRNSHVQWEFLVEIANQHLLCPALYGALNRKDLLSSIPAELRQYLRILYKCNSERNQQLMALARETVLYLNDAGVEPVLLKGTANLFSGLYPDTGMRFLCDIDMLIPAENMMACIGRLRSAGYSPLFDPEAEGWGKAKHYPLLLKKKVSIRLELHRQLFEEKHIGLIGAESMLRDALFCTAGEMRARIPSADHLIIHNIAHTQISHDNYAFKTISLRQLYDFVLMADAYDSRIDWPAAALQFKRNGARNAFSAYLQSGGFFFARPLPEGIQATAWARATLMLICAQANHLCLMRLGNIWRISVHYRKRMQSFIKGRRMLNIWDRDLQLRNYRNIISEFSRRW